MKPIQSLQGEIIAIGDLQTEDLPPLNTPRVVIRLEGQSGRHILISGLTQDECRALASAFMEQVTVSIGLTP